MKKTIFIFTILVLLSSCYNSEEAFQLGKKCREAGMKTQYTLNTATGYVSTVLCIDDKVIINK